MCRSVKHAPILAAVGVFLMARGPFWVGALLLAIAAARLARWWRDPVRTLHGQIRGDAARHGARIPRDRIAWQGLETVYMKYRRSAEAFPTLATEYSELVASMWLELRTAATLGDWRRIVRRVGDQWSVPWQEAASPVDASLARLRHSTRLWREAQAEARGPMPAR